MSFLECCVCLLQYDCEKRKPCMGACGHSICKQCRLSLDNFNCPECRRGKSFSEETINIELLRILQNNDVVNVIVQKKVYEFHCHKCEEGIEDPKVCIDCCLESGILSRKTENEEDEGLIWNSKEKSPYVCIEKAESQSMCINCASENHQNHQLTSIKLLKEKIIKETIEDFNQKLRDFNSSDEKYHIEMKKYTNDIYKAVDEIFKAKKDLPQEQVYAHIENVEKFMKKFTETIEEGLNQLKDLNNEIKEQISLVNDNKMVPNYGETITVSMHSSVFRINLFHKTVSQLDSFCSGVQSIQIGNKVYYMRLISDEKDSKFKTFNVYNIETGERKYIATTPENSQGPMTVFRNKLLLLESKKTVKAVDLLTRKFTDLGKLCKERQQCIFVTYKNDLYVIGGYDYIRIQMHQNNGLYSHTMWMNDFRNVNSIEKFNESTSEFELLYYFDNYGDFCDGIEFNDKIYLSGYFKNVKSLNPITNEWKDEPSFVKSTSSVRFHVIDGVLYAINGGSDKITNVERLDLKHNKWELII